jgi:putative transposase
MHGFMNSHKRREMAIWRMQILGTLVSARLDHGDTSELLQAAASRTYETPSGRRVRYEWRTLERWYYQYKHGGLGALEPQPRKDTGTCRAIPEATAQHLLAWRREVPRRSVQTLIRAAKRAKLEGAGGLVKSSVVRLLRAHGLSQRPRATPEHERRAFTVELPGDLWMGDSMHGPPVIDADGVPRKKAYLLSQIDVASRYVINSDFYVREAAEYQEDGLRRAITGHGLPREYYVDGGSAYIARSLRTICAELGIHLLHAPKGDGAAKGVIERYHKIWRAEIGVELPSTPLPLGELRERQAAWITCEYNRRIHGTTQQAPLEHFLSGCDNLRAVPRDMCLEDIFLHRESRKVRSDGTVRWGSDFLEVPGEYVGETVDLRFAPLQPDRPPMLYVDGEYVCDVHVLDRLANNKRRRRVLPRPEPAPQRTLKGPLDYITDEYRALVADYEDDDIDECDIDEDDEEELP